MKRVAIMGVIALALVGCNQTGGGSAASPGREAVAGAGQQKAAARKDPCAEAVQAQTNAAVLGGALDLVGNVAGLGGGDAATVGHVASVTSNVVAATQSASARTKGMQECY